MFVISNLLQAVAAILDQVLRLYSLVVMVSVLISWIHADPFNPIVSFLRAVTEPVFNWVREHVPFTRAGMMDLSPLIVFIGIQLIQMVVVRSLIDLAIRLRY
jgi:YggT family protein